MMTTFLTFHKNSEKRFQDNKLSNEFESNPLMTSLYFADMAYFSPTFIHKSLYALGATYLSVYNKDNTQAFFAEFDKFAVVGFRGNEIDKLHEIKTDILCWKTEYEGIDCHKGFVDLIGFVSRRILLDIEELNPKKKLLFTGHSLGGALATLFALKCKPTHLFTFGSPRVTGGEAAREKLHGIEYLRVSIESDLISRMPPEFFGYEHFGESLILPGVDGLYNSHKLRTYIQKVSEHADVQPTLAT